MKRKIILCSIAMIFISCGSFIFIKNNFIKKRSIQRQEDILIKGYGEGLYPLDLVFAKGTKAYDAIYRLREENKEIDQIYIKDARSWRKININDKIYKSTTIKVSYR